MQRSATLLFGLLVLMCAPVSMVAQTHEVTEAEIIFSSRTQIERFQGITSSATGLLDAETGAFRFEVPVDSIRTGNDRRDAAMRDDYLLSEQFPVISFSGTIAHWSGLPQEPASYEALGTFIIAGNERELTITGTLAWKEATGTIRIESRFEIALSDFGISRPRFLFVRLNDTQQLEISLQLDPLE